ncbi:MULTISPECIES: CAP domain-containing protein [unclassified Fibrobacter]|uniref:CAP domain-containing protein n=1 Tax=unclassified Fibrobacter TaxID=2634177 RepID=UPI0025C2F3D2|nr:MULTISPECIES: CAP domain-containing protein [unclassified Fibrobacter]
MKKKASFLKICAALAVASFFAVGCSDDSSATSGDDFIDRGEVNLPIPSSSAKAPASSSAKEEAAASSESKPAASSSSEKAPTSSEAASADWRDYCLEVVNAKRATEDLPPLKRATAERESCVEEQAAADMKAGKGHANFGSCNESAQNTGPNINTTWYGTPEKIVDTYVNMMWDDEKKLVTSGERDPNKSEDYSYIGHYLNMKNTRYTSLACGIAYSGDGTKAWFNMNFY